jgi:hypothetical protein
MHEFAEIQRNSISLRGTALALQLGHRQMFIDVSWEDIKSTIRAAIVNF